MPLKSRLPKLKTALHGLLFFPLLLNAQSVQEPLKINFKKSVYLELPLGSIRPAGWLTDQLNTMNTGSTGHLDEVYGKIKDNNGWLGGNGDGWEETPYWLDGAVLLAFQTNDPKLKDKVLKYINWTIDHQRPSGYFGATTKAEKEGKIIDAAHPEYGEDWWPRMVMLKVMSQYYSATQDKRVIPFMQKYFSYQLATLKKAPLGKWTEWAESRGHDNTLMVAWLYAIAPDPKLLELVSILHQQTFQWTQWFSGRDWVIEAATQQNGTDWQHRHGVNVAMAVKDPALNYQLTGDQKYLKDSKTAFNDLMTLHGLPMGIFSADEDLHGNLPTQGVELCATVEAMYSLENIIGITGDNYYMDALERMAFNALPPQTTDDYNNKQYFQVANQVQISKGVFDFSLPFEREMNNVLGMKSGYTCCLANMHQGWTKYVQNLWYTTADHGLAAMVYAPNTLNTTVKGKKITIKEVTNYPFNEEIRFEFQTRDALNFPFELRVPGWCKLASVKINGTLFKQAAAGEKIKIERNWENGDEVSLELPMHLSTSNWGRNSRTIERGPLVYALKLNERWEKGNDPQEGPYWSVFPKESWNYGLLKRTLEQPEQNLRVKILPFKKDFVWNLDHVPVEITATGKKIPSWQAVNGVAHQPVTDRTGIFRGEVAQQSDSITLVPFGSTKVRIVAFPVVN